MIPGKIQMIGAALLAAFFMTGAAYLKGRSDGAAGVRAQAAEAVAEQLMERGEIDAEIADLDIADLCRELGGVYVNGVCQ